MFYDIIIVSYKLLINFIVMDQSISYLFYYKILFNYSIDYNFLATIVKFRT